MSEDPLDYEPDELIIQSVGLQESLEETYNFLQEKDR